MNERETEPIYRAASLYYVQGETMAKIARQLGVSRPTVSRLLAQARSTGLVRITLAEPARRSPLTESLERIFDVRAHVVGIRPGASEPYRLDQVARAAARLVSEAATDANVIGLAWGTTLAAVVPHLARRPMPGTTVVQLNGGANLSSTGIFHVGSLVQATADAFGSQVVLFPVPAFFDYASTKAAMWRERSVQHVLQLQQRIDLALFGVGAVAGTLPSHVYSGGYLDDEDMAQLRAERVVGDVCTVFLREDGSYADIPLNARATGLTPAELQGIPRRICVAAGTAKAAAVAGALRARVATDLVIDDATARELLNRL